MNATRLTARIGTLVAALTLFAALPALAQSTMYADASPVGSNVFTSVADDNTGTGGSGYTVTFNKFDTSLGTLTGVTISLNDFVATAHVTVDNLSGSDRSYTVVFEGDYSVSDSINNVPTSLSSTLTNFTVTAGAPDNGTKTTPDMTNTLPVSASMTFTDTPTLNLYSGTGGTIDVVLTSANSAGAIGGGSHTESEFSTLAGSVSVMYTYTPVPEPGTYAIWTLAIGLGLVFGRRFLNRTV